MPPIIHADNLSRFYGIVLGLNNVTFDVQPGITGVVGPNGSGKTTLFRLLTGQIRPSSGRIEVFGQVPWNNPAVLARLAYCPESEAVPAALRPLDWLVALGQLSGLAAREARTRGAAALERVRLAPEHWRKPVAKFSKGMKQRVKLAQCLLHEPRLIILDEPMNGLDPMGREDFSAVLRQLARDGTSVLISSHILHDLEALCGAFVLLRNGRIPRASNEAASAEARRRWPAATTIRCDNPAALARYLFERDLIRGCEILAERGTLHVHWSDTDRFHADPHGILLASGVTIHEVRSTASFLERAVEPSLTP
ncbi:MAG: ABC transporter ATP-binding protein [Opitutaceae bacterium]|nr:ABC transporter ATP-binding protein [Opitutaceae bacterium]